MNQPYYQNDGGIFIWEDYLALSPKRIVLMIFFTGQITIHMSVLNEADLL